MAEKSVYLGTYTRESEPGSDEGQYRRWNVWSLTSGNFLVQPATDPSEPAGKAVKISADVFFTEFRVSTAATVVPPAPEVTDTTTEATKTTTPAAKAPAPAATAVPKETQAPSVKPAAPAKPQAAASAAPQRPATATASVQPSPPNAQKTPQPSKAESSATPVQEPQNKQDGRAPNAEEQDLEALLFNMGDAKDDTPVMPSAQDSAGGSASIGQKEAECRSAFSLALINLAGNRESAVTALQRILEDEGPFLPDAKYMFSDFGLSLRRRQLLDLACMAHERARQLAPKDEHVLFNLARSLYDSGRYKDAARRLREAISIAPDFTAGQEFLTFLEQSGYQEEA